jgi:hypothetical protein
MKRCILTVLLVLFVLGNGLGLAQEAPVEFPPMYVGEEVILEPGHLADYEAYIGKMVELARQFKYPQAWYMYTAEDARVYFLYPMADMSGVPGMMQDWDKMMDQWGQDKWQALYKKSGQSFRSYKLLTYFHKPDLSYIPAAMTVAPTEADFHFWGYCYIKPGHEAEVHARFREFVKMYTENNIPRGWVTYEGFVGEEMPMLVYGIWSTGAADFHAESEKIHELLGDTAEQLWQETLQHMTRYEYRTVTARHDLSYTPAPPPPPPPPPEKEQAPF